MRGKIAALTEVIPVCQKTCFSPFHQPPLLPSQAQDETSGLLPTMNFVSIRRLGFGKLQGRTIKCNVSRSQCTSQNTQYKSQENQGSLLRNELFLIGRQIEELCCTHLRIHFWLLLVALWTKSYRNPLKWLLYLVGTQQKQKQPQTWFCTATDPQGLAVLLLVCLWVNLWLLHFFKWPVLTEFCSFSSFHCM